MPGKDRRSDNTSMPDTTISAVDKSLEVLLKAEKDFQVYSLDFCSGYVSTDGGEGYWVSRTDGADVTDISRVKSLLALL